MKTRIFIYFFLLSTYSLSFSQEIVKRADGSKVILYSDHTWVEQKDDSQNNPEQLVAKYKSRLRQGIKATPDQIQTACEMLAQGWEYTMPVPKSAQASWGNTDGRTTWYNGYWYNSKTKLYSDSTPKKTESGLYIGDNQNSSNTWRRGGSPSMPDVYMFLLSDSGGPRRY